MAHSQTSLATCSHTDFRDGTMGWLESSDLSRRKKFGQYMTPRAVRERLLDQLRLFEGMRVLDPGVGTGEFLADTAERVSARLHGWDVDKALLSIAREQVPGVTLEQRSALEAVPSNQFDLVIGNPPYFQFKPAPALRSRFASVISGRPNIFSFFFQAGLGQLSPGGQLAYVVPPSMNNGAYFESLREYILEQSSIEYLEILEGSDLFDGANTSVQLIVLQKGSESDDFTYTRRCETSGFRRTVFSPDPKPLESAFEDRRSLWQLGYEAVTGSVIWNQNRERLRDHSGEGRVPLIWAHNLVDGKLVLNESHKRPQYVAGIEPISGPALLVNRIVGSVGHGGLRTALIADGMPFLAENHINVIRARPDAEILVSLEDLKRGLDASSTRELIRLLTGNTQVSATELNHLLPLAL